MIPAGLARRRGLEADAEGIAPRRHTTQVYGLDRLNV